MVAATDTWHKPPLARHASIYEALADVLEGATPSAVKLALYLYRTCIGGKPEEIDINCIPLGEKRTTPVRNGKPYSPNTRRAALGHLEKLGLVKILKNYGRGIFRIAVQHKGDIRPFTHTNSKFQKLTSQSKNGVKEPKIEQTAGSNPDGAVLFTERYKEQQSTIDAAVFLNYFKEEQTLTKPNETPEVFEFVNEQKTRLPKKSEQQSQIQIEDKSSAPFNDCLNNNSDNSAIDVTKPSVPDEIDSAESPTIPTNKAVFSEKSSALFTESLKNNSDIHSAIDATKPSAPDEIGSAESPTIPTNKAVLLSPEISSPPNPDAAEILEAVAIATGGMNPQLKARILQHSLSDIQAAINLLQTRRQTKEISNLSGWVVDCLQGRWWEEINDCQNSTPTNTVSSLTPRGTSSGQSARITEPYADPEYMQLETHSELLQQLAQLGKEAFSALGIQQQVYAQWMQRFPNHFKYILSQLTAKGLQASNLKV